MEEEYKDLAERNGWSYSMIDDRPYFMKDGKYATPTEETSQEDKELLASIISEGSEELEKLILKCWDNGLRIVGPCSGITEFHKQTPESLHFGFIGAPEIITPLCEKIVGQFQNYDHLYREEQAGKQDRYDVSHSVKEQGGLSKEEAEDIFRRVNQCFDEVLQTQEEKSSQNKI